MLDAKTLELENRIQQLEQTLRRCDRHVSILYIAAIAAVSLYIAYGPY